MDKDVHLEPPARTSRLWQVRAHVPGAEWNAARNLCHATHNKLGRNDSREYVYRFDKYLGDWKTRGRKRSFSSTHLPSSMLLSISITLPSLFPGLKVHISGSPAFSLFISLFFYICPIYSHLRLYSSLKTLTLWRLHSSRFSISLSLSIFALSIPTFCCTGFLTLDTHII